MKKYKVFFDTNVIHNEDFNTFFGKQEELKELSKTVDILIPQIVIDEIIAQKKRNYFSELEKLKANKLFDKLNDDIKETVNFDFDNEINRLKSEIKFDYKVIKLADEKILNDLISLAIEKQTPFESKSGTDKGFKDAIIFFTIKQYLESNNDEKVFLCCKDNLLNMSFKGYGIKCCQIDEVVKNIVNSYQAKEFIEKLNLALADILPSKEHKVNEEDIEYLYSNYDHNDIISLKVNDEKVLLEIEEDKILHYLFENKKNEYLKKQLELETKRQEEKHARKVKFIIDREVNHRFMRRFLSAEELNLLGFDETRNSVIKLVASAFEAAELLNLKSFDEE